MLKQNKGIVLFISLIIMTVILIVGAGYLYMVRTESTISAGQRDSSYALYLAESGLEHFIKLRIVESTKQQRNQPGWPQGLGPVYLGEGSYTVNGVWISPPYRLEVTSTGVVDTNINRIVRADINLLDISGYAIISNNDINRSTAQGKITGKVHANRRVYLTEPPMDLPAGDVTEGDPKVTMPRINMDFYASALPGYTFISTTGDLTISANYTDTQFYVRGIATIDVTQQDVSLTRCIVVAEGTMATTTTTTPSGWTELTVDDITGFPSAGSTLINGDIFNYTGIISNTFTGCSGPATTTDRSPDEKVFLVRTTTASASVNTGDTSVTLADVSGFSNPSGSAFIGGESFTYQTVNTGTNTLAGCSGIDSSHPSGVYVYQPTDAIIIKGNNLKNYDTTSFSGTGGAKNIATFSIKNVGLLDVETVYRFEGSWTPSTGQLTQMQTSSTKSGTKTTRWISPPNPQYSSGDSPITLDSNFSITRGGTIWVHLTFTEDMDTKNPFMTTFINTPSGSYTGYAFSLKNSGIKTLNFTVKTTIDNYPYPALATKFGNIVEYASEAKTNRSLQGMVFSEEGRVQFTHVNLQGIIVANEIDLLDIPAEGGPSGGIKIDYAQQYVPTPIPDGFSGGVVVTNWHEVY